MTEKLYYFMIDDEENNVEIKEYESLEEANQDARYYWHTLTEKEKNKNLRRIWVAYLTEEDKKIVDEEIEDLEDTSLYDYYEYFQTDKTTFDSDIYRVYEELKDSMNFAIRSFEKGKDEDHLNFVLGTIKGNEYFVKDIPFLERGDVLTRDEAKKFYGDDFIENGEFAEDGDYSNEVVDYVVYNNLLFPGYTYL